MTKLLLLCSGTSTGFMSQVFERCRTILCFFSPADIWRGGCKRVL